MVFILKILKDTVRGLTFSSCGGLFSLPTSSSRRALSFAKEKMPKENPFMRDFGNKFPFLVGTQHNVPCCVLLFSINLVVSAKVPFMPQKNYFLHTKYT